MNLTIPFLFGCLASILIALLIRIIRHHSDIYLYPFFMVHIVTGLFIFIIPDMLTNLTTSLFPSLFPELVDMTITERIYTTVHQSTAQGYGLGWLIGSFIIVIPGHQKND